MDEEVEISINLATATPAELGEFLVDSARYDICRFITQS
jgi:hypothetical protein